MLGLDLKTTNKSLQSSPNWWESQFPDAVLVADFATNRAMLNDSPASFSDFLTVSRNSEGYSENIDGSLVLHNTNELRISDLGVLIEGAGTNLMVESQNMSVNPWSLSGGGVLLSSNNSAAPDNSLTADRLYNLNNTDDGIIYTDDQGIAVAGKTFCFSIYLRTQTVDPVEISIDTLSGSGVTTTETFTTSTSWQRFSIIHNFAADDADFTISLRRPAGSSLSELYLWGAQLEEQNYASSYIPTTNVPQTRMADNVYFHNLTWLDTTKGTILMNVQSDQGTISNRRLLGFASAQGLETSPNNNILENWNGLSLLTTSAGNNYTWSSGVKIGCSWEIGARSIVMGGGNPSSNQQTIGSLTNLSLGSRDGNSSFWQGYIQFLSYWNFTYSASQLQVSTA